MSMEKYYEVLGLEPDASEQEVKNAYRDLAKVWHPDRFAHDPRLQQKAQEKLKEINEAYAEINSPTTPRRTRRPSPPPPPSSTSTRTRSHNAPPYAPRASRGPNDFAPVVASSGGASRAALPLVFLAGTVAVALFIGYRLLNSKLNAPDRHQPRAASQTAGETPQPEEAPATAERKEKKTTARQQRAADGDAAANPGADGAAGGRESATSYTALPTVNRTIDPSTGLLATRACPLKALRTFASGQEPQRYCDADHSARSAARQPAATSETAQASPPPVAPSAAPPEAKDRSRLKSVISTVASPGKWFRKKKETTPNQSKSGAGQD